MKRFKFPLESLLRWRLAKFAEETGKMEAIQGRIHAVDEQRRLASENSLAAAQTVAAAASMSGSELLALNRFQRFSAFEDKRLGELQAQLETGLEHQRKQVVEANKQVRVLEILKDNKRATWLAEADREQEQIVAELVVAQWNSKRRK